MLNPTVSFSLSMAQLGNNCTVDKIDPEDPRCARVVFSGIFHEITEPNELKFATESLFERHPAMIDWPSDHGWKVSKIDLYEIWLIDIYGGGRTAFINRYLMMFAKINLFIIY
jgi:hypothetical protein